MAVKRSHPCWQSWWNRNHRLPHRYSEVRDKRLKRTIKSTLTGIAHLPFRNCLSSLRDRHNLPRSELQPLQGAITTQPSRGAVSLR